MTETGAIMDLGSCFIIKAATSKQMQLNLTLVAVLACGRDQVAETPGIMAADTTYFYGTESLGVA